MRRWTGLVLLSMLAAGAARGDERLVPGVATDVVVGPGEVRVFLIDADQGSTLHLRADHLHLDFVIRVATPDGAMVGEASPLGKVDPVTLTVIAPRAGRQRIEARLRSPRARAGRFQIRVDAPHPATDADRRRIRAERRRFEADRLADTNEAANFPRMFELYEQSADEFGALGDDFEEARSLSSMSEMLEATDRPQDAQRTVERALPLWRRSGDRSGESRCLEQLAVAHMEQGESQTGLELFAQALALRRALTPPNPYSEGQILNGMAIAQANLGDVPGSIARYTEAIELLRQDEDETAYAVVLKNCALQYIALGDYDRGLADLRDARARFRALGNLRGEGLAEYSIGTTLHDLKRLDEAWRSLRWALPLLEKAGNDAFVALALNFMGGSGSSRAARAKPRAYSPRRSDGWRPSATGAWPPPSGCTRPASWPRPGAWTRHGRACSRAARPSSSSEIGTTRVSATTTWRRWSWIGVSCPRPWRTSAPRSGSPRRHVGPSAPAPNARRGSPPDSPSTSFMPPRSWHCMPASRRRAGMRQPSRSSSPLAHGLCSRC